ncbi:ABC transporter permease [Intrasporangium chromatireducens]|nr:ABC transporter permease [Intrasporangium chromatireducens]
MSAITSRMVRKQSGRRRAGGRVGRGIVGVAVAVLAAQLLSVSGAISPTSLPPMFEVLGSTGHLFVDPSFLREVLATIQAAVTGLAIATAIAVPAGLVLGSFRLLNQAASAVVEFLRPIPSVALIPLAILLFGQGAQMKVSLVVYASVWPIFFNTIYGVRDVEPLAKETARIFRIPPLRVLTHVLLPSAAPFVATGIRVAAAIALIVTISAELLAGSADGLGAWILRMSSGGANLALVYAGTIFAGLLGLVVNWLLVRGEQRLFRWRREGVGAA